jgi:hypothetical protein
MAESVRLSEASRLAAQALACFDGAALDQLASRLEAVTTGEAQLEAEPVEAIENNQKILAGVLMATEQNLAVLYRLRERKAGNEWVL